MFLQEYGLPELNEELCIEAIKNKEGYVNVLKNGLLPEDPIQVQKDEDNRNTYNSQASDLNLGHVDNRKSTITTVPSPYVI